MKAKEIERIIHKYYYSKGATIKGRFVKAAAAIAEAVEEEAWEREATITHLNETIESLEAQVAELANLLCDCGAHLQEHDFTIESCTLQERIAEALAAVRGEGEG